MSALCRPVAAHGCFSRCHPSAMSPAAQQAKPAEAPATPLSVSSPEPEPGGFGGPAPHRSRAAAVGARPRRWRLLRSPRLLPRCQRLLLAPRLPGVRRARRHLAPRLHLHRRHCCFAVCTRRPRPSERAPGCRLRRARASSIVNDGLLLALLAKSEHAFCRLTAARRPVTLDALCPSLTSNPRYCSIGACHGGDLGDFGGRGGRGGVKPAPRPSAWLLASTPTPGVARVDADVACTAADAGPLLRGGPPFRAAAVRGRLRPGPPRRGRPLPPWWRRWTRARR